MATTQPKGSLKVITVTERILAGTETVATCNYYTFKEDEVARLSDAIRVRAHALGMVEGEHYAVEVTR